MAQLTDQIALLTQKLAAQEAKLNQMSVTKFELTADQIIRNFNEIPPFSGEDGYKLKSFLKTVQDVESLCGNNNQQLQAYCLSKVINGKIIGKARNTILEIPENKRSCNSVVETLTLRYRPKQTIYQLLFQAKDLKVYNLKDLFNKLNNIKSEASEICDFDNKDSFTYEAIDKELVQVLKSKLIPILQVQVDQTKSLFELEIFFCESEIYLSDDVIKHTFKINKTNKMFQNKKHNNSDNPNPNRNNYYYNSPNFYNPPNFHNNPRSNIVRTNNNNRYSGQYRQPNFIQNRSGQYRNNNNNNRIEPMEVDNINKQIEINQEVNFTN